MHLGLEAGDVAVTEVLAELVHLLQLQQVDTQHLDRLHHLARGRSICRVRNSHYTVLAFRAPLVGDVSLEFPGI